jgi:hypothetical protein
VEPTSGLLLELGKDYAAYIAAKQSANQLTLALADWQVEPSVLLLPAPGATVSTEQPQVTIQGVLYNQGTAAGCNLQVQLWQRTTNGSAHVIDRLTVDSLAAGASQPISFTWQPTTLAPGSYELLLSVSADNGELGLASATTDVRHTVLVLQEPDAYFGYLPFLQSEVASR